MLEKKITFDRFIRGAIVVAILLAIGMMLNRLSAVLLPFFVAWFVAYMMYPLVCFLQYRCRLRNRALSITAALLLVFGAVAGIIALIVPPMLSELDRMSTLVTAFVQGAFIDNGLVDDILVYLHDRVDEDAILNFVQQGAFLDTLQNAVTELWTLLVGTIDFVLGLAGAVVVLLYLFFILMDYEKISEGWVNLIPETSRPFAKGVIEDVERGMNAYFRGQSLVALCVGILFSIGFLIIDFPMAIGLGLFIGALNLVPYLQLAGFIPTVVLALLKANETGQSFWVIMACVLAVFAVVQTLQDFVLTPRIMGKAMGLNPAIILLSLSVWGSLLGFIGLIVALPLTTLVVSYYKRFVLKEK